MMFTDRTYSNTLKLLLVRVKLPDELSGNFVNKNLRPITLFTSRSDSTFCSRHSSWVFSVWQFPSSFSNL